MRKRTKIIGAVVVLILILISVFAFRGEEEIKYSSAEVTKGEVLQTVSATGGVEAKKKIDMKFSNSGQIESINFEVGDDVKEGDVIASLDVSKLESQLTQAKASLQNSQANLRILLEGATSEEIQVYETAVNNAETALESAKTSSKNDIASAESSVASAEVTLENAETSLENVIISNENSLNNVYEDAWNSMLTALADCDDALDANKTVLENEDAQNTLSAENYSYLSNSDSSKLIASNSYDSAASFKDSVGSNPSFEDIENSIDVTIEALQDTRTTLSDTSSVLQATITSSALSQTELDALKYDISVERSSVNTSISALTSKKQTLSSQKVANQTSLDSATAAVNSASSALLIAQNSLVSVTSSSQSNIVLREGDLQRAKDQLTQVKAGPTSAQISSSQAQVNQAAASVELIEKQIDDSSIVAPYDGIITSIEAEVGETISSGEVFVSLIFSNGFEIKANISEVDISKLSIGDEVEITFDALGSSQVFEGEITEIDPAETEISGVVYYKVSTIFVADKSVIKPGMTANLDIMTAKREDVVKIPFQALREREDGEKYVKIVDESGDIVDIDIETGLKGDIYLEVLSGLGEGQKVVTFIEE